MKKGETLVNAVSYGEVFIVEDTPFIWWITCNICKDKFESLENFLNHICNLHLNNEVNETLEIKTKNISNEVTKRINAEDTNIVVPSTKFKKDYEDGENVRQNIESDFESKIGNKNSEAAENNESEFSIEAKSIGDPDSGMKNLNQKSETSMDTKPSERHQCSECCKSYSSKQSLRRHIKIHFGLKPIVKCKECGITVASNTSLGLHMRIHTGERPEKCSICPKAFRTKAALKIHIKTHTGEKRFSCSFCDRKFRIKVGMQIHERVHTDEKPAQCDICGGRFRSNGALKNHRIMHGKTGTEIRKYRKPKPLKKQGLNTKKKTNISEKSQKKKFQCKVCLACVSEAYMKQHVRTHNVSNDYLCKICNNRLRTRSGLECHMEKEHKCKGVSQENYVLLRRDQNNMTSLFCEVLYAKEINKKEFVCQICSSSFATKKSLKMHERFHAKTKDYKCNMCNDEFFRTYADINYHMRKKHSCVAKANFNYTLIGGRHRK